MEGWGKVALVGVDDDGDLTQLYPNWAAAGVVPSSATTGQQIRRPCEGTLVTLQVETDGSTGGTLELYDISGIECGADVSSLTAITNAQLTAALADGRAKCIYSQNFVGSGLDPWPPFGPRGFMKGLAARFVTDTPNDPDPPPPPTIYLNLSIRGGYHYTTKAG